MKYTLKIWYATSPDDKPQVHKGLSNNSAQEGTASFLRDLFALNAQGVRRIMVEAESDETQAFKEVEQAGTTLRLGREAAKRAGFDVG